MSKRNIAFIKPSEPSFIRKLKEQAGFKEGPTIDTKRQNYSDSDSEEENTEELNEEEPTVVILKPGDLTAAEAEDIQKKIDKEKEEKPADLDQPIVFKSRKAITVDASSSETNKRPHSEKREKSVKKAKTSLLSFNNEDEED